MVYDAKVTEVSRESIGGLFRALEIVGRRWALLIVQVLAAGPKRFTDLRRVLPRIPTNVLSARLKELEYAGVLRRHVLPRPDGSVVYELTDYGSELTDIIRKLDGWGTRSPALRDGAAPDPSA